MPHEADEPSPMLPVPVSHSVSKNGVETGESAAEARDYASYKEKQPLERCLLSCGRLARTGLDTHACNTHVHTHKAEKNLFRFFTM